MSRVAFVRDGKVINVAMGDQSFADATGGVVCPDGVAKGWSYDGADFTPPPAPSAPTTGPDRLHRGDFAAHLLTAQENDAWIDMIDAIEQTPVASRTADQKAKLRAWRHFTLFEMIARTDERTQAAIFAMHLWGILTQPRADRVALFLPPEE